MNKVNFLGAVSKAILFYCITASANAGTFHWIDTAGGLFDDPLNWAQGSVPGIADTALFNISGTPSYTISLAGTKTVDRLLFWDDYVTLSSGIYNTNYLQVGRETQTHASLTLVDTTINSSGGISLEGRPPTVDPITRIGSGSTLSTSGDLFVAFDGGTANVEISGGGILSNANAYLGAGAIWSSLPDGIVNVSISGPGSTWTSTGQLILGDSPVGVEAHILVEDSAVLESSTAIVGEARNSIGTVEITSNSQWNQTQSISNGLVIGHFGDGSVTTSDSSSLSASAIVIGNTSDSSGNLTIEGVGSSATTRNGAIYVGSGGTGVLDILDGTVSTRGGMIIGRYSGSDGTVNVDGSEATLVSTSSTSTIKVGHDGDGVLNISNGGTVQAPSIVNNGHVNVSGTGVQTIDGDVTNSNTGTIKTTNTTLEITGTFTNNGAYISDPSDNIFGNLVIDSDGYLVGGEGDRFILRGDFTNNSTQNALWDTDFATLVFDGTGAHNFILGSEDFGMDGAANNFNWGTMRLESGVSLNLFDADGDSAALYVGLFDLADGIGQLSLINSPFDIYYDASLAGNAYLAGETISLAGGAVLTPGTFPAAVPIPPALWLFGSGLIGLVGMARRKAA